MQTSYLPDWAEGTTEEHLEIMRAAAPCDLTRLAAQYDWGAYPEPVLGWVMAQKSIDLGTAIAVFLGGGPERFNYFHKREVPVEYQASARLLDNICLRVNCGFYLVHPAGAQVDLRRLRNWMWVQKDDRANGQSGRWVLDEGLLQVLFERDAASVQARPAATPPRVAGQRRQGGLAGWAQRCLPGRTLAAKRG